VGVFVVFVKPALTVFLSYSLTRCNMPSFLVNYLLFFFPNNKLFQQLLGDFKTNSPKDPLTHNVSFVMK